MFNAKWITNYLSTFGIDGLYHRINEELLTCTPIPSYEQIRAAISISIQQGYIKPKDGEWLHLGSVVNNIGVGNNANGTLDKISLDLMLLKEDNPHMNVEHNYGNVQKITAGGNIENSPITQSSSSINSPITNNIAPNKKQRVKIIAIIGLLFMAATLIVAILQYWR